MVSKQLILATRNKGKILEFKKLLSGYDIILKDLNDFGPIPEIIEDGNSFEDNAYKKALTTAKMLGIPALADDSGLVVEILNGKPGIYSARYSDDNASDKDNNNKLLQEMRGETNRKAQFECVLAIAVPRGPALIYDGICKGEIMLEPIGKNGFGYDPLFYYPPFKKTFAQLNIDEKNKISHRGLAMTELRNEFEKVLIWLDKRIAEEPF